MNKFRRYGLAANGREEALRALKRLLEEYEQIVLGSKPDQQSDEDYLSKFDDL
jgi:hypothetical protein